MNTTATAVTIYGPELNREHQAKGMLHIHAEGCQHGTRYRYLGEHGSFDITITSKADVVRDLYGNTYDNDEAAMSDAIDDLYFAPCISDISKGL